MSENESLFGDVIYSYTDEQAVDDGILFNLSTVLNIEFMKRSPFSLVSGNPMNSEGYMDDEGVNIPNLTDLFSQALDILKRGGRSRGEVHYHTENIEFPSGHRGKIAIALNMSGRYTIMLPEDY